MLVDANFERRRRESSQNVLIKETMNGFSSELSSGVRIGADVGAVNGAGSNLLTFGRTLGVSRREPAIQLPDSISSDAVVGWGMGDVLNESVR